MKKKNKDLLNSFIFDNGKEYLLKLSAIQPLNNGFTITVTISADNIKDFFSNSYNQNVLHKGVTLDPITIVSFHNPIQGYTQLDCHIFPSTFEKLIYKIRNMNRRRYKIFRDTLEKESIKSRSELLDIS